MELLAKRQILKTRPFNVEELDLRIGGRDLAHPYYRLDCPDWVNVLAVTTSNQAVLIRQARPGPMKLVLETPGGVANPGEKDLMMAALRELEEETGYTSSRVLPLASLNPNPAIQNNTCHFFVALACHVNPARRHFPDIDEVIETELVDVGGLDGLVRTGRIDHALSALCILLAGKYIKIL